MLYVTTDPMDRHKLVGWIVRDQIIRSETTFSEAARQWGISRPTLNRLMFTGVVRPLMYAKAEKNLGLPDRLLSYVAAGDTRSIRDLPGLDETLRAFILRELGHDQVRPTRRKRA